MANTRVPQNFQIRKSSTYTDTTTPTEANFETNPVYLEDDMNNLRSVVLNRSGGSNWWDDFNDGSVNRRKIATLGTDLDVVETKDFLFNRLVLVDIPATTVLQILTNPGQTPGLGTVPAAVTSGTEGAVATGSANFGATRTSGTAVLAADLFSTGAPNALRPLNLGSVVDGTTGDPVVTTNGNQMKCLLITERTTDGAFGNNPPPGPPAADRGAIVFVEINATNDGYIYATASDLPASINYTYTERSEFLNLNEWAFLNEPSADAVAGTDVTLTLARTNQSGPVLPNNKDIDWQIGNGNDFRFEDAGNTTIASFAVDGGGVRRVTLGTAAGTDVLTFEGATFDVNVSNDATFAAGIIVEDGGNQIRVGQTSNTIDNSTGALSITGAAGLTETATTGNFTMTATTGAMDLQAATAVTIDSSGGAIGIGTDDDAQNIDIGTSATAVRTITMGNDNGATAVNFDSGTGAFSFDSTTADTSALMDLNATGAGGTSVGLFVGTSDPNTRVTANAGSLFIDSTAALWQNTDGTNTGWVAFGSASGNSLQQAYIQGETIQVSDAEGTLAISNTDTDTGDMMTITNTQTGATDQNALVITMTDSNSTGEALTIVNGGVGDALNVQDGAANTVFQIDGNGAVAATPTSGQNFTVLTAGAGVVDIDTGAGGVDIDSTGSISLDAAGASNFNTTVGNLSLVAGAGNLIGNGLNVNLTSDNAATAGDINLTGGSSTAGNAAGGDIFANAGDGFGAGAGGAFNASGGTGGGTDGTGGAVSLTGGTGGATNGSGGALTANAGVAVGTGNGGTLSLNAGDAVTSGTGGFAFLTSGDGGTTGTGGDLTIQSGDGGSASGPVGRLLIQGGASQNLPGGAVDLQAGGSAAGNGGSVNIAAGDSASGAFTGGQVRIAAGTGTTNGYVRIQTAAVVAVTETDIIATFENNGTGTGGGANVSFYTEDPTTGSGVVPSHSADSGSLYWQQRTGLAPRLFMNTSTGTSGNTWSQIDVGGVSGSLEAAWEAATGAGAILGNGDATPNSFTGSVSDTYTYLINTTTGSHTLLSLGAVFGGDVVTVGHNNEAAVLNLDSGTGGTSMDSTGGISITADTASDFTVDSAALTLETTTSGAVNVTAADNVVVTSGAGDDIDLNATTATTAGAVGGAYTLDTGAGAAGTPGVSPTPAGDGGGGTVVLGNGAVGTPGAAVGQAADAGNGGSYSLTAGDGGDGTAGAGAGLGAAPGAGGSIGLTAGDGGTDPGAEGAATGGSIFLTSGASTVASGAGLIHLRTAASANVNGEVAVVRISNQGTTGTGDEDFDIYVRDATASPSGSVTALSGSLMVQKDSTPGVPELYFNTTSGAGVTTGNTWEQVVTADATAGARQFAQVTVAVASIVGSGTEGAGTNLTQGNTTGTMPTRASGHDFDTQSEIYFNGVLMMNGTGNDVKVATLGATTVDIHLLAGANLVQNDIVTIVYYNI